MADFSQFQNMTTEEWQNKYKYGDIFNYTLGNNRPSMGGGENNSSTFMPMDQLGNPMPGFQYHANTSENSGNPTWSYEIPEKYQGVIDYNTTYEGPMGQFNWNNNYRNLPNQGMTKFGPIEQMQPYNPNSNLYSQDMWYEDPLYGPITPTSNSKPDKDLVGTWLPRAVMAAGGAWMGSLAAPGIASSLGVDPSWGKGIWNAANMFGKSAISGAIPGLRGSLNNIGGGFNLANQNSGSNNMPGYQGYGMNNRSEDWVDPSNDIGFGPGGVGGDSDPWGFQGEVPTGGGGDISVGGWLGNALNSYTNGIGVGDQSGLAGALTGPAALAAMQQWRNAGQYRDLGKEAAAMSDPFASQRAGYQKRLFDLYNDPTAVLNDPAHKATQTKQMNAIQGRNRAAGYMGSGKDSMDLADYQAQSDAQYLTGEKALLAQLSGSQFNPANAGAMLMKGGELAVNSENAALGTAMAPYTAYLQSQYAGNRPQAGGQMPGGGNQVRTPSLDQLIRGGSGALSAGGNILQGASRFIPGFRGVNLGGEDGGGNVLDNLQDYGDPYGPGSGWGSDIIGGGFQPDPLDGTFGPQLPDDFWETIGGDIDWSDLFGG